MAAAAVVTMTLGGSAFNASMVMGHVHAQTCEDGRGPHWMLSTEDCVNGGSTDDCYDIMDNEVHLMGSVDNMGMSVMTNVGEGKDYADGATEGNPLGEQSAMGQSIVVHHPITHLGMACCTLTWSEPSDEGSSAAGTPAIALAPAVASVAAALFA